MRKRARLAKLKAKLPLLLRRLGSKDEYIRGTSLELVLELCKGDAQAALPALTSIVERLDDDSNEIRLVAARALLSLGNRAASAAPALRGRLRDEDHDVVVLAAEALINLGAMAGTIPALLSCVEKPSQNIVRTSYVYEILARLGKKAGEAISTLREHLVIDALEVQTAAAKALAAIVGKNATTEFLLRAVEDRDAAVRAGLPQAIADEVEAETAIRILVKLAQDDVEASVRAEAIWALGRMGATGATVLAMFRAALNDQDGVVRAWAANGLLELEGESPEVIRTVSEVLESENQYARAIAVSTLSVRATAGFGSLIPYLIRLLADRKTSIACNAGQGLAKIGPAAVPGLIGVLQGGDFYAHYWASQALLDMQWPAKNAKEVLVEIVNQKDAYSVAAGDEQSEEKLFIGAVPDVALMALSRVVNSGDVDAVSILIDALTWDHEKVRKCAARGLGKIGKAARAALPALRHAREDGNKSVRLAVEGAIHAIE